MTISDKTRKILWGKSGNRCAICRQELVIDPDGEDDKSVIGEECHIVARELNGARGDSDLSAEQRDNYENLILLCRIHHKLIDDQPNTYNITHLSAIKSVHETWVQQSLNPKISRAKDEPFIAFRVDTGRQLVGLLGNAQASRFDNDELTDSRDADVVASFFQKISDYIDIWGDLQPKDRIMAQVEFEEEIRNLKSVDFIVYGCVTTEKFGTKENSINFRVITLLALRTTNLTISRKDENLESIMQDAGQRESQVTNFILVKNGI